MAKGETLGERVKRRNARRVLLVDDHPIVRDGYSMTLGAQADLEICGEASDAHEAMAAVVEVEPDIVLLDLSLKGVGGMELIGMIHAERPRLPILIVSMHDEATHAVPALRAGAKGYVMKQESTDTVIAATRAVLDGRPAVDAADIRALAAPVLRHRILTNFHAEARRITSDDIIETVLSATTVP